MNKMLIACACFAALSGCAEISATVSTLTTSASANETVANANIIAADKVKAKTAADQFCTMTVTTLAQNPQWVKPVETLCWNGQATTASAAADASIPAIPTKAALPPAQ